MMAWVNWFVGDPSLDEITEALKTMSAGINIRFDDMDRRFDNMNRRFDNLRKELCQKSEGPSCVSGRARIFSTTRTKWPKALWYFRDLHTAPRRATISMRFASTMASLSAGVIGG
jgi:hypothetical protein